LESDMAKDEPSWLGQVGTATPSTPAGWGPEIPGWEGPEVDLGGCVSWSRGDYCVYATQGYECSPDSIAVQINYEGEPHRGDLALAGHVPLQGRTRDEAIRHLFEMLGLNRAGECVNCFLALLEED